MFKLNIQGLFNTYKKDMELSNVSVLTDLLSFPHFRAHQKHWFHFIVTCQSSNQEITMATEYSQC